MRICIVSHRFPPDIGGNELYAESLAQRLFDRGHEVVVYTTRTDETREYLFDIREFTNAVPQSFGYFAWPGIFQPKIIDELRRTDVVHAVNASMFTAVVGAFAKRLSAKTKTFLTTTYHPPRVQTHKSLKRIYDRVILQHVLRTYDELLVSSQFELSQLQRMFNTVEYNITRLDIPPMVTVDSGPPIKTESSTSLSILFVGRLDAHKGVYDLLQAVSNLSSDGLDIECIVVGERERWFEWPEEVNSMVKELSDSIDFRGFVPEEELARAYTAADVLVLPSEYETFGQVIVEALQYGTPVVATPVGIAPERITDGENGFVYDPSDSSNLTEALRRIHTLDQFELRKRSIESVSDLSWESLLDQLEELYSS